MYVTNEEMMKMAKEVVVEHASLILHYLGFSINDAILNRFIFSDEVNPDTPLACCDSESYVREYGFKREYIPGSASIVIYPIRFFYRRVSKTKLRKRPFARFFKNRLRKKLIFVLAHELRHYYQFESGEMKRNEATAFGVHIMPYEYRWSERDANDFAKKYTDFALKGGEK